MDTNKRKTGLARLIEIAGTKRRLLIGAMLLAVITAIVQFVPIIAVYNILIELAEHALDPSLIDKAYIWLWSYIALGAFFAFGVLTFASLMLSHIAAQVESLNQADTLYILDHARSGIGLYFLMPLAQGCHKVIGEPHHGVCQWNDSCCRQS